jgi:hypothetical protein
MAYDQSTLKYIGPIRQRIQAHKREKKAMRNREKSEPGLSARQEKNLLIGTAVSAPIAGSIVDAVQGGADRTPTTRGGKFIRKAAKKFISLLNG